MSVFKHTYAQGIWIYAYAERRFWLYVWTVWTVELALFHIFKAHTEEQKNTIGEVAMNRNPAAPLILLCTLFRFVLILDQPL